VNHPPESPQTYHDNSSDVAKKMLLRHDYFYDVGDALTERSMKRPFCDFPRQTMEEFHKYYRLFSAMYGAADTNKSVSRISSCDRRPRPIS
jgi:hypothetical protein